ncbi:MAG: serine/threonine protein kinase [Lachnospiraceae bacterium]|nr:serine/threonine protein kinase [Lachnospiraceae bacterium]
MNEKYPLALPENTVLSGQYIIQKVLGQGGFGITYKAVDRKNGNEVAIKEFFPETMASRVPGTTEISSYSGEKGEDFKYGKQCFLQEAETLARFIGNRNIVRIYSYFEEYGTAYFVMDYIRGTSLDEYVKQHGGKLGFEETADILVPVMDALGAVHEKGIVHRDVSPDNIYITDEGDVKLIDFGAARQSLGDKSQSLDVILKHGFAPKEQYTRRGKQGPYTDIYALGATFYYVLTGERPPDSIERMDDDELVPPSQKGVNLSASAESAILMALSIQPADRFQSMSAFKNAMLAVRSESSPGKDADRVNVRAEAVTHTEVTDNEVKKKNPLSVIVPVALILVVLGLLGRAVGVSDLSNDYCVKGNNINNIVWGGCMDPSASEPESTFVDENGKLKFRSISKVGDEYYALFWDGTPVRFNGGDGEVVNPTDIEELNGIEGIERLFVSDGYFFVWTENEHGWCVSSVSRKDGSIKMCAKSNLRVGEFTFTQNGRFCFLDWDGVTGDYYLLSTPGNAIDQVGETIYTFKNDIDAPRQIFCADNNVIYVYSFIEGVTNRLFRFDLGEKSVDEPAVLDLPDDKYHDFTCDGKNIFNIIHDDYNTSKLGIIDFETGETNLLSDLPRKWNGLNVYPENKGVLTLGVGEPGTDRFLTIP